MTTTQSATPESRTFDELDVEAKAHTGSAELVKALTAAFGSDDTESFYKLIDPDSEWVIMATGETFRGLDQIKQLTTRSQLRSALTTWFGPTSAPRRGPSQSVRQRTHAGALAV